jgi:hypothetical protein
MRFIRAVRILPVGCGFAICIPASCRARQANTMAAALSSLVAGVFDGLKPFSWPLQTDETPHFMTQWH